MSPTQISWIERIGLWFGNQPKDSMDALPVRVHGQQFTSTGAAPGSVKAFDQSLIWAIGGLLMWGLVMVYSASIAMPDNPKFSQYQHSHFLMRHLISLGLALVISLALGIGLAIGLCIALGLCIANGMPGLGPGFGIAIGSHLAEECGINACRD
jgi:cell division protein FtsW